MLTFIISMRARVLSKSWAYHTWLLERTIDSCLAQTHPGFDIVVVCHDVPAIAQVRHRAVHMLPVSFPVPDRTNDDMCADKALKVSKGIEWAMARKSEYVMFVDADDLVSRRLAAYVAGHAGENGWYFHSGYFHTYGQAWVRTHAPHYLICGTGTILKTSVLRFERSELCRGEIANTLASAGIDQFLPMLTAQGTPIVEFPFPGAMYILHPDSTSEVPGGTGYRLGGTYQPRPLWKRALSPFKRAALTLPTLRPITPSLRAEFTIPANGYHGQ